MGDPVVTVKKPNRAKIIGAVLCMAATLGCIAGAAANGTAQAVVISLSTFLFLLGLGAFVVGRLRE